MPSPWTPACLRSPFVKKNGAGAYARQSAPDDELERCYSADDNCNHYDAQRGTAFVELTKKERATLGLILSGGIDKGSRPKIANLRPGSLAYRSDALCVGDLIVSVNGIRTGKLKHEEIVNLLKNAGEKVQLEVEYDLPYMASDSSPCICSKVIQVRLEKENGSFGFVLRGGANVGCPLTVTYVRPGGPADRDGTIKAGDRILAVDNYNVCNVQQSDANSLLRQIEQEALFTVEYDVSLMEAVRNAAGPLLVEIERSSGGNHQLGVALSSSPKDPSVILIQSIKQASLAERCGALHVGDRVLSIDGLSLDTTSTAAEASQLLRNSCGERIRLEILPLSQMMLGKRVPDVSVRKANCSLASSSLASFATLGSNYRHNQASAAAAAAAAASSPQSATSSSRNQPSCRLQRGIEASPSSSSLPSCLSSWSGSNGAAAASSPLCSQQVCRLESVKVLLVADARGFGFSVCAGTSAVVHGPPIVGSLDPGGPAERCSVIQVGDRILAVNEISTEGMALDEVTQMISGSKPKVMLHMEFDIAESVVPSSGVFDVKLARKGWGGLGITITAAKDERTGRAPVITEVKRGSSAHRSGTIQVGDQLLAIGSTSTTVDDGLDQAIHALQQHNCGQEEIVRLRIRKEETDPTRHFHQQHVDTEEQCDEDDPEMPSARGWLVYSVELQRRGSGPLGLTLAGSDRPSRPVLISALAEGGAALRTGTLQVGDRLLAVDGLPVRGKTLGQVIQHLQSTVDAVVVKLARKAGPDVVVTVECEEMTSPKCAGTPLPSIDSAVESWDSTSEARNSCASYGAHKPPRGTKPSRATPTLWLDDGDQENEEDEDEGGDGADDARNDDCGGVGEFERGMSEEPEENWPHSPCGSHSGEKDERDRDWIKVLSEFGAKETTILPTTTATINGNGIGVSPLRRRMSDEHLPTTARQCRRACDDTLDSLPSPLRQQQQQHCSTLPHGCGRGRVRGSHPALISNGHSSSGHQATTPPSEDDEDSSPYPIEVHRVTLFKDTVYEDFGFSVSDGLYERGVYVNRIRPGGPADIGGILRPFDRILQVNDTKTHDFDCCLTVPLIAAAGDRIHLMLVRNPQTGPRALHQHEGHVPLPLTAITNTLPWMEEENENNETLMLHCANANTVIKSL